MLLTSYKKVTISKAGIMTMASRKSWGAHYELETDIRTVFPYVNAIVPEARFHGQPEYIFLLFDGIHCTLYPHDIIAAPFCDEDETIILFQKLTAFLNDLYARRDEIVPDHRKYRALSVIEVFKLLPGTNCRECGYPTCLAFAGAMRQGETAPDQCPGFAKPVFEYAVYPVYDPDGRLISTVTIEKDPEKQKEMPERTVEIHEIQPSRARQQEATEIELGVPPLTNREKEVLRLVAGGSTNNEISEALFISPHTVKSHVIHIFNKLGVNDRTQAAVIATQKKLVH